MIEKKLVEIRVAEADPKQEPEVFSFSTGYVIGNNLVITAAHVLGQERGPIQVRVRGSNENNDWLPEPGEVKWDGRANCDGKGACFDVAILSFNLPGDVPGRCLLCREPPEKLGVEVDARGYPRTLNDGVKKTAGGLRDYQDLHGRIGPIDGHTRHFKMNCDGNLKDKLRRWMGVSGAPVFQGEKLAGIIEEYIGDRDEAQFRVAAMCRLLDDPDFCKAIGWFDTLDEDRRAKLREEVSVLLSEARPAGAQTRSPARRVALEWGVFPDPGGWSDEKLQEELAASLVEGRDQAGLRSLVEIHGQLCKEGNREAATRLAAALDLLLPVFIDHQILYAIRDQIRRQRVVLIDPSLETRSAAEAAFAAVQQAETSYKYDPKRDEHVGEASIDLDYPAPGEPDDLALQIVNYLYRSLSGASRLPAEGSLGVWAGRLKGAIEARASGRIKDRTRYCIVGQLDEGRERSELLDALGRIKEEMKDAILFVELRMIGDLPMDEAFLLTLLNTRFESERGPRRDGTS
jgi:hypothetical protein